MALNEKAKRFTAGIGGAVLTLGAAFLAATSPQDSGGNYAAILPAFVGVCSLMYAGLGAPGSQTATPSQESNQQPPAP